MSGHEGPARAPTPAPAVTCARCSQEIRPGEVREIQRDGSERHVACRRVDVACNRCGVRGYDQHKAACSACGSSNVDTRPAREPRHIVTIQPDAPALLAERLVRRLERDGLARGPRPAYEPPRVLRAHRDALVEALADEIHQSAVDGTLRGGA